MKIIVCVKIVNGELNPFDECALESALSIPDSRVSVVSMCPISAKDKLLSLTRLGVENVYLLSDKIFAGSDTLATAYILSKQISSLEYDAVFCGRQSVDGDTAQVGACLSVMLGTSLVTNVMDISFSRDNNEFVCRTRLGQERAALPALLTIERINTLRFPSVRSRIGEINIVDNSTLGANPQKCGTAGSPTRVLKVFENKSGRRRCHFADISEFVECIELGMKKKTANFAPLKNNIKFDNVWAIGSTVAKKAAEISETVTLMGENDPYKIYKLALEKKPNVILWNADLRGRRNAPVVQALLGTGLCADCTALETDGNRLYMYRPAREGNIIAKIECTTRPQMATVRCSTKSDDIIFCGGRGIADSFKMFTEFAGKFGASVGASRALVDRGLADYGIQIGLTGKAVSPKVYVAIGVSGAIQHMCAIESAGTVIAVNPDKNAPVFEYADYGIVTDFEKLADYFVSHEISV